MDKVEEVLKNLENLIRLGQMAKARKVISQLNLAQIPRKHALQSAHLAYRANFPSIALRILGPYVKGTKEITSSVKPEEIAEYALSLSRLGATREAGELLSPLDHKLNPDFLLYEAFAYITEWKYSEAIPLLVKFINQSNIDPYRVLVAKTNLAASYIHNESWPQAESLLEELREVTHRQNHKLLLGNALELSAQIEIFKKNYHKAKKYLDRAESLLKGSSGASEVYVQKWMAIHKLYTQKEIDLTSLLKVKKLSEKRGLWESVRDCDLYISIFTKDVNLIHKVYFGTPHATYRRRVLKLYPDQLVVPNEYVWTMNSDSSQVIFDIKNCEFSSSKFKPPRPGQKIHQLIGLLCSDYYRPFRMGTLFSFLFQGESFDPFSSPDRIYQIIRRVRNWAKNESCPLTISSHSSGYYIDPQSKIGFKVSEDSQVQDPFDIHIDKMNTYWNGGQLFSLKDIQKFLKVSQTQAYYILQHGLHTRIQKVGRGPQTKYKFVA